MQRTEKKQAYVHVVYQQTEKGCVTPPIVVAPGSLEKNQTGAIET